MELMGIKSDIQQYRHNLLRIRTHSQTELMDRSLAAVKHQIERFILSLKLIGHIVICLRTINPCNYVVEIITAYSKYLKQKPF